MMSETAINNLAAWQINPNLTQFEKQNPSSRDWLKYQINGNEIAIAIPINLINLMANKIRILRKEAPITFRIPISFLLWRVVGDTKPQSPALAITVAMAVKKNSIIL